LDFNALLRAHKNTAKTKAAVRSEPIFHFEPRKLGDISQLKVGSASTVYYIPEWITPVEEKQLILTINADSTTPWHQLTRRKLKMYGGVPVNHSGGMIPEKIPAWLELIFSEIKRLGLFPTGPNHVLLNEYLNGQGIGPHRDGPLYLNVAAVLSLGGSAVIDYFDDSCLPPFCESLFLEGRSLLIFTGEAYDSLFHRIAELQEDKLDTGIVNLQLLAGKKAGDVIPRGDSRLSLTMRTVAQIVSKDFQDRLLTPEDQQELKRREAFFYKSISEKN